MATKNGARYLREQLDSILHQLNIHDELIISDDCSTDETVNLIRSYNDPRIRLVENSKPEGIPRNFEKSLTLSRGQFIFLADQDDVWLPQKIDVMCNALKHLDLVVSDCLLVDHSLRHKSASFFSINNSGKGLIRNILKNSYIGCCMAFNRKLLSHALPFPKDIPMHDLWIGIVGELHYKTRFIPEVLVYHRRHESNASSTGGKSTSSPLKKFGHRYKLIKNILLHRAYA